MVIKMAFYGPLVLANQYGVSRHVLDKKPTVFLFDLYKWKSSQTNERVYWIMMTGNLNL